MSAIPPPMPAPSRPALPKLRRWACALGLAVALPPGAALADPVLGRLFSTPAERAVLDGQRGTAPAAGPNNGPAGPAGMAPADATPAGQPPPGAMAAPPSALTMNGVLRSSGGAATVWFNDAPRREAATPPGRDAGASAGSSAVMVTLPSGKKVLLKAGQRYELGQGQVKDLNEP